ncbi:MAG: hypothetical protein NWT08_10340 [Akkermansiaceae bacterium]|nr:hypothetical protein [Akkermansiaceae bacterium]MDP4647553.1 hypothetical protein [Akkermansiaceae bacterium]MDP4720712.1 hypothetical protein [Akkermansiaceae bacterium]MDP4897472.1 hypothetical protein [Akkermansiaceae bacterium]
MKILLASSALVLVPLGYHLGSRASVDENIQAATREVRLERELQTGRDRSSPVSSRRDRAAVDEQPQDLEEIYRRIGLALEKPTRRGINESVMAILQLSAEEVEELFKLQPDLFYRNNSELASAGIARLIELDPEVALKLVSAIDLDWRRMEFMQMIYKEWAAQDPDTALAAALLLEDPKGKESALEEIIKVKGETDPEGAISMALELGEGIDWSSEFAEILKRTAATDPERALEIQNSFSKSGLFSPNADYQTKSEIMRVWLENDPDKAKSYIQEVEDEADRSLYTTIFVAKNLYSDPQTTLELLDSNKDNLNRTNLSVILMKVITAAPDQTIEWIEKTYTGEEKDSLMKTAITRWYNQEESAASAYFNEPRDPELKQIADSANLSNLRSTNPSKYLQLYPELTDNSDSDQRQFIATLEKLAIRSPESAREYIDRISDPAVKSLAMTVQID